MGEESGCKGKQKKRTVLCVNRVELKDPNYVKTNKKKNPDPVPKPDETDVSCQEEEALAESLRALGLPTAFGSSSERDSEARYSDDVVRQPLVGSPQSEEEPVCSPPQRELWVQGFDFEVNLPYYFCQTSGVSQWELPDEGFIVPATSECPLELIPFERRLPLSDPHTRYWRKRYSLFSAFDQGIRMNEAAWYSVTPEILAKHQAEKLVSEVGTEAFVVDAFSGVGGNAIQLARCASHVLAFDICTNTIENAKANASLYGVRHKIDLVCCDFFTVASSLKADAVFLSPPWGGKASSMPGFSISRLVDTIDTSDMVRKALQIAPKVALYLPKVTSMKELKGVMRKAGARKYQVEQAHINKQFVAITVYIG